MSPHDERRSCWPRAKYGAGLGRAIWAARRRRHPESLNNRTGPPTEELTGLRHQRAFAQGLIPSVFDARIEGIKSPAEDQAFRLKRVGSCLPP